MDTGEEEGVVIGEVTEPLRARYAAWLGMDRAQVLRDRDEDPARVRAIQILLRLERDGSPSRGAALALAASGCAALCLDERSAPGGEWFESVSAYCTGHIRKVTRRGRGAQWHATAEVPGLTLEHGATQIRVLVPGLVGELDRRVAKLQVGGTDLPAEEAGVDLAPIVRAPVPEVARLGGDAAIDAETVAAPDAMVAPDVTPPPDVTAAPDAVAAPDAMVVADAMIVPVASALPGATALPGGSSVPETRAKTRHAREAVTAEPAERDAQTPLLTVHVPADLEMTAGKLMAQTGHAGMLTVTLLAAGGPADQRTLAAWRDAGCPCRASTADAEGWAALLAQVTDPPRAWREHRLLPVRDAGFTEVAPGTVTVIGQLESAPGTALT